MAPPPLPTSLSPHVLVLSSPDLDQLLSETRQLPPLHQLLQSFCPLQQVTTRTNGLTPVTHANFNIRFSALSDVENACKEDDEERSARTIDWIGTRIAQQAAGWLENPRMVEHERWWTELRACAEGERAPIRGEGWNHPVALILATSTLAPNPLQAITALHSRALELPPWVDQIMLKYTLIVHPTPSNLDPNEAVALLNAVKKQFGLNTHLLQLPSQQQHDKMTFEVPIPLPQLPSLHASQGPVAPPPPPGQHSLELLMSELDAQNTSRFVREFVTMALLPWMERCVGEWNEAFTSTRRISTRLFGSTARRFFGSGSSGSISSPIAPPSSSSPNSNVSSSTSAAQGAISQGAAGAGSTQGSLPPHRRLAEFATILGDYKLATAVWDVLRKDSPTYSPDNNGARTRALSNGSDILPLIVAPGPAVNQHALAALSALGGGVGVGGVGAAAQLRALVYAVRWEVGVSGFHGPGARVEGERWLAWAAGGAEEPTSALLLGRAASISARKGATRRAALWFATAARRLERSGIKPLTIHFFEQANEAWTYQKESLLSPSFFDIEGTTPSAGRLDGTKAFLDHSLGRLKYSSGDTRGAVLLFAALLRPPPRPLSITPTSVLDGESSGMYLADFRDALEHYISTHTDTSSLSDVKLPITFARAGLTRVRLASDEADGSGADALMAGAAEFWGAFRRREGEKGAKLDVSRSAIVGEPFWLNVTLYNPLSAEVTLANVTVVVAGKGGAPLADDASVEVETLPLITLPREEQIAISIRITPHSATSLTFPSLSFTFLSLLPVSESLGTRGRRLNDTPIQRQGVVYAPDVLVGVDVREGGAKLVGRFVPVHGEEGEVVSSSAADSEDEEEDEEDDGDTTIGGIGLGLGIRDPLTRNRSSYTRTYTHTQEDHQEEEEILVFDGEIQSEVLVIRNAGARSVEDVWLVLPVDGSVWVGGEKQSNSDGQSSSGSGEDEEESDDDEEEDADDEEEEEEEAHETLQPPQPHHLSGISLKPGETHSVPVIMRHSGDGASSISVLVVFRESANTTQYLATRACRSVWVQSIMNLSAELRPASAASESLYSLSLEIENIGGPNDLAVTQINAVSSTWKLADSSSLLPGLDKFPLHQLARAVLDVHPVPELDVAKADKPLQNLSRALTLVLEGKPVDNLEPPERVGLCYSGASQDAHTPLSRAERHFIRSDRRNSLTRLIAASFPSIPASSYAHVFPLYTSLDMDVAISYSLPSSHSLLSSQPQSPSQSGSVSKSSSRRRHGIITLPDSSLLILGARHGALKGALKRAEEAKAGRSMYAETGRERAKLLDSVRGCRWNEERDPIMLGVLLAPGAGGGEKSGRGGVVHDFANGPCLVPLTYVVRNESTTLSAKVTLRMRPPPPKLGAHTIKFIGGLTKRGIVPPGGQIELYVKALASSPGIFDIPPCALVTEIGREEAEKGWVPQGRYEHDAGDGLQVEVTQSLEAQLI